MTISLPGELGLIWLAFIAIMLCLTALLAFGLQYTLVYWASYKKRRPVQVHYGICFGLTFFALMMLPFAPYVLILALVATWIGSLFTEDYRYADEDEPLPDDQSQGENSDKPACQKKDA